MFSYDNDPVSTTNNLGYVVAPLGIEFDDNGGNTFKYKIKATARQYTLTKNPASGSYHNVYAPINITTDVTVTAVACLSVAKNVTYTGAYSNKGGYIYSEEAPAQSVSCDTLDIACQLGNAWNGVSNTFLSVGQTIVSTIGSFFTPDEALINQKIADLQSAIYTKLGFLTYPVEFFVDLKDAFDNPSQWCNTTSCTLTAPGTFFGGVYSVDFLVVKNNIPNMWTLFTTISRGILAFTVIMWSYKRFMEILKHDS